MNQKQLIIILLALAVLGGAGLVIYKRQNDIGKDTDQSAGKKVLANFPINDVAQITIKEGTNELNLEKKNDLWRVRERKDYPANYSSISDFLIKAGDLKIAQSEELGPSQMARLSLTTGTGSNSAEVVDFKDKSGKTMKTLLLGKKHSRKSASSSPMGDMDGGWPDGRYVKLSPESDTVILVSDPLASIEAKPDQWLNKDFFKVEKLRSLSVQYPVETNSWKISRDTENGEWKLADAKPEEKLDTGKTGGVTSALNSPSFNDVAVNQKPEELGLDKPTKVVADTFDNFTYTLTLGQKTNDHYALTLKVDAQLPKERTPGKDEKPADKARLDKEFQDNQKKLEDKLAQEKACEGWTYLASTWTFDSLLKNRGELLVEKKEEKPASTPTSIPSSEPLPTNLPK